MPEGREAGGGRRDAGRPGGETVPPAPSSSRPASRLPPPAIAFVVLFGIYAATLAPDFTFWDAGELIAAIDSLGIPHPPGTPLYVVVGRAWSDALGWLPRAQATNLLSAVCTAAAAAALARLLVSATGQRWGAMAAAVCAGAASSVWLTATETEVYAASLLLSWLALLAADRAGRTGDPRWLVLTAYALGLSVPLHMSALVAAPAAVVLAAQDVHGRARWGDAAVLGGGSLLVAGVGTASPVVAIAGLAAGLAAARLEPRGRRAAAVAVCGAALLACTCLAMLPLRAAHDPAMNAGNPTTWDALWDVVARRQYGEHRLWPRRAPPWLQAANLFEYLDWQFALGLGPGVAPTPARTAVSLAYGLLGLAGAAAHRRADRRSWRAFVVLFACGSLGLVAYMNFKAGASFAWNLVPEDARHEVRERDYFFLLAFMVWGAWAGFGAVSLIAARRRALAPAGLAAVAFPIALNWPVVTRRAEPEARLPRLVGEALLWSVPPRAVLVTGGDDDSFPTWYLQVVDEVRRDVSVVVAPLLGARWYREELARRGVLRDSDVVRVWRGEAATLAAVAATARSAGRPLAVAVTAGDRYRTIPRHQRVLRGFAYVEDDAAAGAWSNLVDAFVDTAAEREYERRFAAPLRGARVRESTDPLPALMLEALRCPAHATAPADSAARADSVARADGRAAGAERGRIPSLARPCGPG